MCAYAIYRDIVENPMDFNTVTYKVLNQEYKEINSFKYDVDLIFSNCIEYNGDVGDIANYCVELADKLKGLIEDLNNTNCSGNGMPTSPIPAARGNAAMYGRRRQLVDDEDDVDDAPVEMEQEQDVEEEAERMQDQDVDNDGDGENNSHPNMGSDRDDAESIASQDSDSTVTSDDDDYDSEDA